MSRGMLAFLLVVFTLVGCFLLRDSVTPSRFAKVTHTYPKDAPAYTLPKLPKMNFDSSAKADPSNAQPSLSGVTAALQFAQGINLSEVNPLVIGGAIGLVLFLVFRPWRRSKA